MKPRTQDTATVEHFTEGTSAVSYKITGSAAAVQAEVDRITKEYHPVGYGTRVERVNHLGEDLYEVTLWRAYSCD